MSMLSFKEVESNYGMKEPCKLAIRLLSFLIVWISDSGLGYYFFNSNSHEEKNLWNEQLLIFFKEKLISFSIYLPF